MSQRSTATVSPPIPRSGRVTTVAKVLKARIKSLEPGDRLPSFSQMRAEFGIAPNTSDRVYTLLANEGYIERRVGSGIYVASPKLAAQAGVIGFAMPTSPQINNNPYWMSLIEGMRSVATKQSTNVLLIDHDSINSAIGQVDGILWTGTSDRRTPLGKPVVHILGVQPDAISVVADEAEGISQSVQHLLFLGHRRIAYLYGLPERPCTMPPHDRTRTQVFVQAMGEAEIAVPPEWLRSLSNKDNEGHSLSLFEDKAVFEVRRWLKEGWSELGCTAVICQNDSAAIGAMQAFRESGLRIPADVSVIGFDGVLPGRLSSPALTTVEMPLTRMAERGTELLLAQIKDGEFAGPKNIVECLPVHLRVRASTGPAPRSE